MRGAVPEFLAQLIGAEVDELAAEVVEVVKREGGFVLKLLG